MKESVFSVHHVGPGDRNLRDGSLYPLRHLAHPGEFLSCVCILLGMNPEGNSEGRGAYPTFVFRGRETVAEYQGNR